MKLGRSKEKETGEMGVAIRDTKIGRMKLH
jgi:hypothetical protein